MSEIALVFGATGTLGSAIAARLELECSVVRATRSVTVDSGWVSTSGSTWPLVLQPDVATRVIWAQGRNASGGLDDDPIEDLDELFEANVAYIVRTLARLREAGIVSSGSRLCVVSSVWQAYARDSKLAYVTTKSAVGGLVRALAADLGPQGIAVNALLPGVVHSAMTEQFLSSASISRIESETPTRSLVSPENVAEVAAWLTSAASRGIHGQSIVLDNGWSVVRHV